MKSLNNLLFRTKFYHSLALFLCVILGQNSFSLETVSLNPSIKHQTIDGGWIGHNEIGQYNDNSWPGFIKNKEAVIDSVASVVGITHLMSTFFNDIENTVDYHQQWVDGKISKFEWRSSIPINDNNDPFDLNMDGFQFSYLDLDMDSVIMPMKKKVEALGKRFFFHFLCMAECGAGGLCYEHNPEEYAEMVLAIFLHMKSKYGVVPDYWEMINEPGSYNKDWSPKDIADAMMATGKRLEANGFTPGFIAPSVLSLSAIPNFYNGMKNTPGIFKYWKYLSYHLYNGVSNSTRLAVADICRESGLKSCQLEYPGTFHELHNDLILANNSMWATYALGGGAVITPTTKWGQYAYMKYDGTNLRVSPPTRYKVHYFKHINEGAVRIEASTTYGYAFNPVAFINPDGNYVVVMKGSGGPVNINGLPAGNYGINYTLGGGVSEPSVWYQSLPDVNLSSGETLKTQLPGKGVMTIFGKNSPVNSTPNPEKSEGFQKTKILWAYPNPFNSKTNINFENPIGEAELIISNIYGQRVKRFNNEKGNQVVWDAGKMPDGIYLLKVIRGKEIHSEILLLQK